MNSAEKLYKIFAEKIYPNIDNTNRYGEVQGILDIFELFLLTRVYIDELRPKLEGTPMCEILDANMYSNFKEVSLEEIEELFDYKEIWKRVFNASHDSNPFNDLAYHLLGKHDGSLCLLLTRDDRFPYIPYLTRYPITDVLLGQNINCDIFGAFVKNYIVTGKYDINVECYSDAPLKKRYDRLFCPLSDMYTFPICSEDDEYKYAHNHLWNLVNDKGSMVLALPADDLLGRHLSKGLKDFLEDKNIKTVAILPECHYFEDYWHQNLQMCLVEITKEPNDKIVFIDNIDEKSYSQTILADIDKEDPKYVRRIETSVVQGLGTLDPFVYFTDPIIDAIDPSRACVSVCLGEIAEVLKPEAISQNVEMSKTQISKRDLCYDMSSISTVYTFSTKKSLFRNFTRIDRPVVIFDYKSGGIVHASPDRDYGIGEDDLLFLEIDSRIPFKFEESLLETDFIVLTTKVTKDSLLCRNGFQDPGVVIQHIYYGEDWQTEEYTEMSNDYLAAILLDPDTRRQIEAFRRLGVWEPDYILNLRIPDRTKEEIEKYIEESKKKKDDKPESKVKPISILAVGDNEFCDTLKELLHDNRYDLISCDLGSVLSVLAIPGKSIDIIACDISNWQDGEGIRALMECEKKFGVHYYLFAVSTECDFMSSDYSEYSKQTSSYRFHYDKLEITKRVFLMSSPDDMPAFVNDVTAALGAKEDQVIMDAYGAALDVIKDYETEYENLKRILGSIHFPNFHAYQVNHPENEYTVLRKVLEDVCRVLNAKGYLPDDFIDRDHVTLSPALKYLYGEEAESKNNGEFIYGMGKEKGDYVISPSTAETLKLLSAVTNNESHTYTTANDMKSSLTALQGYALLLANCLCNVLPVDPPKQPSRSLWRKYLERIGKESRTAQLQRDDKTYFIEITEGDSDANPLDSIKCYVNVGTKQDVQCGGTYEFYGFERNEGHTSKYPLRCSLKQSSNNGKNI